MRGRVAGVCVPCQGRAFNERHRAVIEANDPRKRANWEHHPAHDGSPVKRVYKPLKGLQ